MLTQLTRSFCLLLLMASLSGCGQSPYNLAPATGVVTLDGKPFVWGSVMFAPIAGTSIEESDSGKPAFGMLDSEGRFELSTYGTNDGAVVGQHRVTVFCVEDGPNGPAPKSVPEFRRMALRGDAVSIVAGEDNSFTFELTSDMIRKYGSNR